MEQLQSMLAPLGSMGSSLWLLALPLMALLLSPRRGGGLGSFLSGAGIFSLLSAVVAGVIVFSPQLWTTHAGAHASLVASLLAVPAALRCFSLVVGLFRGVLIAGVWLAVCLILVNKGIPSSPYLNEKSAFQQATRLVSGTVPHQLLSQIGL